ncbi:seven in absentia of Arabidopsis 2 [Prunus dulcis]|uniref:RING-type E3 ubiquitin transferase n=1 Tax=Prunus dulcis TaxID=3755 RepID=A0A4Y1RU84_PRUDU|nr:seven in absentia of Arabidopsis 2 [Prunus dulcis]
MASTDASKALFFFNFHIRERDPVVILLQLVARGGIWLGNLVWDLSYCYFKVRKLGFGKIPAFSLKIEIACPWRIEVEQRANYDMAMAKLETGSMLNKTSPGLGGKNGLYSTNGVHELLECPVCTNLMYPPIHQCPNGHTLCSDCKIRVHNCCPTCRYELGDIRCLALEKVAESLELPCRYQSLGCHDIFPYYSKLKHEQHCRFRLYNCPYAGSECSVTGDIPTLVGHLKEDHKVDMHDGCTFNHRYVKANPNEVENATWMLTVFNCFGRQFCLHFEAFQLGMAPVYMAFLRFMGDDIEAKKFSYSLEVGANGRKLIWQGIPRSIRDSHRKVRDSQDGLIIQRNLALYFSGGDKQELKLRITGLDWNDG